jgi:hypothetical protein
VKIDAEGAERPVLCGMKKILQDKNVALMVEMNQNQAEVYPLLREYGFLLFDDCKKLIQNPGTPSGNVFCFREEDNRLGRFSSPWGTA